MPLLSLNYERKCGQLRPFWGRPQDHVAGDTSDLRGLADRSKIANTRTTVECAASGSTGRVLQMSRYHSGDPLVVTCAVEIDGVRLRMIDCSAGACVSQTSKRGIFADAPDPTASATVRQSS